MSTPATVPVATNPSAADTPAPPVVVATPPAPANIPPELQPLFQAAQAALPGWAKWIFGLGLGPLLLTTYTNIQSIPALTEKVEKQGQAVERLEKSVQELKDLCFQLLKER